MSLKTGDVCAASCNGETEFEFSVPGEGIIVGWMIYFRFKSDIRMEFGSEVS